MPRISAIKQTKKGRYALFLDDTFAFSLDEATFAQADLHENDEPSEFFLEELRRKSDSQKAVDKALDLLSLRDHTAGDLYQKLCRKFDPDTARAAVEKVREFGYLNDEAVGRRRAAELLAKHKSRMEISRDLAAKGIDRPTISNILQELYDGADLSETNPEQEAANALVERHYLGKLRAGKRENVAAALARRGFRHEVIRTALDHACQSLVTENEQPGEEEP